MHNWNTRKRRENGREDIFEIIQTENFTKLMTYITTNPGSS